jgi:AcrR family transcriptional regulator
VPRAKQRTPALRDRVLHTAVALLAEEGPGGFTTRKVAQGAATSIPAVYELFGDKAGLVREVYFEGFRKLRGSFDQIDDTDDPRADLVCVIEAFRSFVRQNPVLAEVMFSRPFADFDPGSNELSATSSVREFIVGHVRRCINTDLLDGDETDIAHVLLALAQGLAAQETAGWLGTSKQSVDRRWAIAFRATLDGLAPARRQPADSRDGDEQASRRQQRR